MADDRKLMNLARKNREASKAAHDAEVAEGDKGKGRDKRSRRPDDYEEKSNDDKWEGADRLFNEMKKRSR